jgi:mannose-6-phosphate isomerase-like protein (cupin superfamily)
MKWLKTVVGLLALTVMTVQAQGQVTFKYISAGQAAQMVSGSQLPTLASDEKFSMSLHKRVVSGHVEKHMGWNEELVIQKGDVLLNYGDTASNPREMSPGEFNGDAITGGRSVMLHAGDIVILPAGLWHQQILKGPIMRYILFKTRNLSGH